jgi:hypothetical protein
VLTYFIISFDVQALGRARSVRMASCKQRFLTSVDELRVEGRRLLDRRPRRGAIAAKRPPVEGLACPLHAHFGCPFPFGCPNVKHAVLRRGAMSTTASVHPVTDRGARPPAARQTRRRVRGLG